MAALPNRASGIQNQGGKCASPLSGRDPQGCHPAADVGFDPSGWSLERAQERRTPMTCRS